MAGLVRTNDTKVKFATIRRRRLDPAVEAKIEELAARGWTPKRIYAELDRDPELASLCPTLRTIQRRVEEIASRDKSGAWRLAEGTADEAVAVFRVLPVVIMETRGSITAVTRIEAACLARLMLVAGDLAPWSLYVLARAYVARQQSGVPVTDLDAFVAFRPWVDQSASDAYGMAVGLGYVPRPPRHLAAPNSDAKADWASAVRDREGASKGSQRAAQPYIDDALALASERANAISQHIDPWEQP